ncbi:MAG: glycerophosphodiester phosphodiesterase family protein [Burkholderiaceae bacterium]
MTAALTGCLQAMPRWWAHRGGGSAAPENTLAAIRHGHAQGLAAVEFDVMLSKDGVALLHHDWTVGRTAQGGHPGAAFAGLNAAELQTLDSGAWHSLPFAGERIPDLQTALALCEALSLTVNLELKAPDDASAWPLACECLRVLQASPFGLPTGRPRLVVSSFSVAALQAMREAGYIGSLALLYEALPDDWILAARDLHADAVHLHQSGITPEQVRRIHTTRRAVRAYTVNEAPRAAQLLADGVDGLFTDRLALASAAGVSASAICP